MTAGELIEQLKKFPPETPLLFISGTSIDTYEKELTLETFEKTVDEPYFFYDYKPIHRRTTPIQCIVMREEDYW